MKANFYRGFICLLHSLHSPPALGSPEASVGKEKGFLPTQLCQEGRAGRAMRACKFGQNILIPPPHSGPAIVADLAEVDILIEKDAGYKHIKTQSLKGVSGSISYISFKHEAWHNFLGKVVCATL